MIGAVFSLLLWLCRAILLFYVFLLRLAWWGIKRLLKESRVLIPAAQGLFRLIEAAAVAVAARWKDWRRRRI